MAPPTQSNVKPEGYLDTYQASRRLGITTNALTSWARKGKLKDVVRIGRYWFFNAAEIKEISKAYVNRLR